MGSIGGRNLITPPSDKAMYFKDAYKWLEDNLGYTEDESRTLSYALEAWTNYNFSQIHNEYSDVYAYPQEYVDRDIKAIDKYLEDPRLAKASGVLYRGLTYGSVNGFSDSDINSLESILNSGVWKEPGITAFSSDVKRADAYTQHNISKAHIGVVIEMHNNQHAVPIGHLSAGGGEKESLYPSSIKSKGLKIVSWTKERTGTIQRGKRQGQALGWKYHVIVEDR